MCIFVVSDNLYGPHNAQGLKWSEAGTVSPPRISHSLKGLTCSISILLESSFFKKSGDPGSGG